MFYHNLKEASLNVKELKIKQMYNYKVENILI